MPVPLREGGEDPFCGCKFEAAVAAGDIREFFVVDVDVVVVVVVGDVDGEASVSSRMRNRLTARRDWDICF